ncbi:MAG: response regulator transcription factor [Clostridia bacterium]|nr:response regulator transcription factor [Clostridia bacterium]
MAQKILIVDDEISICDLLKITLKSEGYEVETSHDGLDALKRIQAFKPDLMILDLMLPGMNGFDICKKVTLEEPIPIIMLTAKTDIVDKILGLELGADDYITKPFHARELAARVKALLRRTGAGTRENTAGVLRNGSLEVHQKNRKATICDKEIELSAKEFDLLVFLLSNVEQVFSREALLDRVWGYDFAGDTRTVDVHVQRLRKKLKDLQDRDEYIQTVFGVGYRMVRKRL